MMSKNKNRFQAFFENEKYVSLKIIYTIIF